MACVASRAGGVEMPARVARPAAAGGVAVRAAQDCRCVACAYKREGGRASVCQMSARPISEFSSRASSHRSGSDIPRVSSQRFSSAWANEKFDELPIRASSQRHSSALDAPRVSSQRFSSAWANEKFDELPIRASSQRHSSPLDVPRVSSRHSALADEPLDELHSSIRASSQRLGSAWANEKFDEFPLPSHSSSRHSSSFSRPSSASSLSRHSSAFDAPRASSLSRHSSALDMRPPSSVLKPWTWSRGYSNPISAARTVLDDDEKIRELTYRNDFAVRRAMGGYY